MKHFWFVLIVAFRLSGLASAQAYDNIAGQFDYYVLALTWQPGFCEIKRDIPECRSQPQDRYDAKNLVLHGLWPSIGADREHTYGFCGVSQDVKETDKIHKWCELPPLHLSENTSTKLTQVMPGTQSCLDRHEWFRHGTCSGLSESAYFAKSLELVEAVAKTHLNAYIANNAGTRVRIPTLQKEFEKDFGKGSRKFVVFRCARMNKVTTLTEVRLYFRKDRLNQPLSLDSFIEPDPSERGTCRKRLFIDLPGSFSRLGRKIRPHPHDEAQVAFDFESAVNEGQAKRIRSGDNIQVIRGAR